MYGRRDRIPLQEEFGRLFKGPAENRIPTTQAGCEVVATVKGRKMLYQKGKIAKK